MNEDIMLVKQSYREARESKLVGKLDLLGMVFASACEEAISGASLSILKLRLEKEALIKGATHIFGIDYNVKTFSKQDNYSSVYLTASGDAYRTPSENIE